MLYFDHCATTPPYPEVIETVGEVMGRYFGNPSSIHKAGIEAERMLGKARESVARLLRSNPEEIVFTSGGTESNNLAIMGAILQFSGRGKHVITTELEHASVYEIFRRLEANGFEVTYIKPDRTGRIQAQDVLDAVRDDTILVSVMHVNNEIGTIQPVIELGQQLKRFRKLLFHVDAVQSVGKIPVYPSEWGIDLLSVSGHKIRGPKGTGFLYKRKGIVLQPLLIGGGQEHGLRSGTENVPGIVGLAKAYRLTMDRLDDARTHMLQLRRTLLEHIRAIPELVYNGSDSEGDMAPHIVNCSAPGYKPEVIVHALEQRGMYISTRSACSSGEDRPSRVLLATGADLEAASSGLRISFSPDHTLEEADRLGAALAQTLEQLRRYR